MTTLSPERLRQLFTYDPDAGILFWNRRPLSDFATRRAHALWNTKHAGKAAGSRSKAGYVSIKIDDRSYLAHRLIWAIVNGSWPEGEVDHGSGVTDDNRVSELRSVSHAVNQRNQKRPLTNKSGAVGVRQNKKTGRWLAEIEFNGIKHHLGCFGSFDEAVTAREIAAKYYGFHPNHGRDGAFRTTATGSALHIVNRG